MDMKKFMKINLVFLCSIILAPLITANEIYLIDDLGWIIGWEDEKYVDKNNIDVKSDISISISPLLLKESSNFTFKFSPFEPGFFNKEVKNLEIRVNKGRKNATKKDYQVDELKEIEDKPKSLKFTLFLNKSQKKWQTFHISIDYILPNFVNKRGQTYDFSLMKKCNSRFEGKDKCGTPEIITDEIIFIDRDIKIEKHNPDPNDNYKLRFVNFDALMYEGYKRVDIEFTSIRETEFLTPLMWTLIGAVIGAGIGAMITWIITKKK